MGRHSSAAPEGAEERRHGSHTGPVTYRDDDRIRALGPITDPLLLDAVQQEMRRSRPAPATRDDAPRQPAPAPRSTPAPGPQARSTTAPGPTAHPTIAPRPQARPVTGSVPPSRPAPVTASGPVAPATAPPASRSPQPAPAPPVSARRTDAPGTGDLPALPAALHRGRTGADATTGRTPVSRPTTGLPTGAVPTPPDAALALDLRPRRGGSSVGLSAWAVGGGLAGGVGLAVLLSLLAYWR